VTDPFASLAALADAVGIETSFWEIGGIHRVASPEALMHILQLLGIDIDRIDQAHDRLRAWYATRPVLEPVHVAWDGNLPAIRLQQDAAGSVHAHLTLLTMSGENHEFDRPLNPGSDGAWWIHPQWTFTPGYHHLRIDCAGLTNETLIIASPRLAHAAPEQRTWGAFLPLYAFGSGADDVADYGDLQRAACWIDGLGGSFIGTLPLLATLLDEPFAFSPYSPASRLFWNDLFIDLKRVPGLAPEIAVSGSEHERAPFVDYRRLAADKRAALMPAANRFFDAGGEHDAGFREYLDRAPHAYDYARFRAACDRFRGAWMDWPEPLRSGVIRDADVDARDTHYHLFAAWLADEQLARISHDTAHSTAQLYLDLPIGVNPVGYDAWRERDLFANSAAAGAPPDAFFEKGQNWGFRPLIPDALRRTGYSYVIETLRHHMHCAHILRIDHVMSLNRLYWVPDGLEATQGVYVRYPHDELFAIVTLESTRHGTIVVGEDLGTVPDEVRTAMRDHGIYRTCVMQFELAPDRDPPLASLPENAVASLNTHDLPPFNAFWKGLDILDRQHLGAIDEQQASAELAWRQRLRDFLGARLGLPTDSHGQPDAAAALRALCAHIAQTPARMMLVNIEDLWLETLPQNVPGTSFERPNWSRRARFGLDHVMRDANIAALLEALTRLRRSVAAHA
jgi:4-alpha-glucanotransferase